MKEKAGMETARPSHRWGKISVILVILLLAGAALVYYESSVQRDASSSQISSLKAQVTNLELVNSALQSQVASLSSGTNPNSTAPESLYANAITSVVTISGEELVVQNTFFGQLTQVVTVQGSGFVVDYQNSSYIVTNYHVVGGVSNITVTFSDGNSYPANVKGSDQNRDLAVLTTDAPKSEFVPLQIVSLAQDVRVGESVYAIGSPFGLSGSMTFGIVSQTGRTITESTNAQTSIPDVIQFSAPINPGNSGGPLLDSAGQVIGITTAAVSSSQGLGFAIPSSTVYRELPALVTTGSYTLHPLLGINATDMNYQLAQATGSNVTYGVLVQTVAPGGAAEKAGIHGGSKTASIGGQSYMVGGDILVSINGVKLVDSDAMASYLEENTVAGQTIQVGIIRSGTPMTVTVVLGALSS
jgi:S1-C subfamily serine protease